MEIHLLLTWGNSGRKLLRPWLSIQFSSMPMIVPISEQKESHMASMAFEAEYCKTFLCQLMKWKNYCKILFGSWISIWSYKMYYIRSLWVTKLNFISDFFNLITSNASWARYFLTYFCPITSFHKNCSWLL